VRRALLIPLLLLAPAVQSQTAGAGVPEWELVYECSQRVDDGVVGLAELEQACPGLEAALGELGYLAFLSDAQREDLTVYSLEDLQHIGNAPAVADPAQPPRMTTLRSVLDSMEKEAEQRPLSWWNRFENWIRELLKRRIEGNGSWLEEWLQKWSPSELFLKITLYSLVGLVILLAILVVLNELRAAGVLRRGAAAEAKTSLPGDVPETRAVASLADLQRLPLAARPAALLCILVNALVNAGRLSTERSLTYRELTRRASFHDESQRASFARIATAAERSVYGRANIAEDELDELLREGKELYERLAGRVA